MSRALKQEDERGLSKLYESEFNKPDLHDRVLIFDVVASHTFSGTSVEQNVSDESEGIDNEASKEESGYEATKTENVETGVNTSDASEDCEIVANGNQELKNKSSNEDNNLDIGTASNKYETQETEVTNEHKTVPNENVETNENTGDGNKIKSQRETEITKDENDANSNQSSGQSGREIYSESNDEASYPNSKQQIIRQHKFYIHSTWLAVQSSYFRSLFFSGMKESNAKEVHVQISTNEEQSHLMLLEAMYKIDTLDNSRVDELLDILQLAHKYDVKFVFKKCKYCLQDAVDSLETCEQIMHFIKIDNIITDVEDLVSSLQSFLAKEFSPLDKTWQTTRFKELCEPSLKYLLSSDELVTVSENTVFHALMYWIEERGIENVLESQELPSLLSVVRFELIPVDYLYNIVQHNPVAKKLPDFNDHYLRGISYHALSKDITESLPSQSVKRKGCTGTFVPFSWVIPKDKLDALVETDKDLKSDEFWYCGYRVRLTVSHVKRTKLQRGGFGSGGNNFSASLSLEILNLSKHSVVEIAWRPYSEDFHYHDEKKHKFKNDAHMSSFVLNYDLKRQPITTQPVQLAVSPAFSFGSTALAFESPMNTNTFVTPKPPPIPKEESPATPGLSIDINMRLV